MVSKTLKNAIGFVLLGTASLTFLQWAGQFSEYEITFALAMGYVLLAFAWMDFAKLAIYVFPAFGAIAGFFLGNLDALLYAAPVGLAYLLFGALMALGIHLDDMGYHNLSIILALLALVAAFFAGMAAFAFTSQLHYEGRSSVNWHFWFWSISIVAIVLSIYLLPRAWEAFSETRQLAVFTGLLALVMFYLSIERAKEPLSLVDRLWRATLYLSAIMAGVWAGFGMIWILQ